MKKTIVLIGHKMRQGKDTFAEMLSTHIDAEIIRFADPMKQIVATTFGVPVTELENAKNDGEYAVHPFPSRYDQTYRDILQRFGTEAMKPIFGNDVWARLAVDCAREANTDVVLIPDFRFYDEYLVFKAQKDFRVVTVNVKRDDSSGGHSSETGLDQFRYDKIVENNGTLEDLGRIAKWFAHQELTSRSVSELW